MNIVIPSAVGFTKDISGAKTNFNLSTKYSHFLSIQHVDRNTIKNNNGLLI